MEENQYRLAGWLAITQAVLFPLGFVIGILQSIISAAKFGYDGPSIGPADLIFIFVTFITIYTLIMLRRLVQEQYGFHEIDFLITLAIWWNVLFQVLGLMFKVALLVLWPVSRMPMVVVLILLMSAASLTGGVLDILIAVRLLKIKDTLGETMRVLVYLIMAAGICHVTIVLTPIALLILPVYSVVLGLVFLKAKEQVEFV